MIPHCPNCSSPAPAPFFEQRELPVLCNARCLDRESARTMPHGDMQLACCADCGCIWNTAFDSKLVTYDASYDNALHFSPTFAGFSDALIDTLVERFNLAGKTVAEFGCGSGEFLEALCAMGDCMGIRNTLIANQYIERDTRVQ